MFIYQPHIDSTDRTVWYGGESTQLHYERCTNDDHDNPEWVGITVCTLGGGLPTGMSELRRELVDYYNWCQCMEHDSLLDTL